MADDSEEPIVIEPNKYAKGTVLGHGSFGIVYESVEAETNEPVAIKAVYQDRRYKNRELQIMRTLDHPNVVKLKHFFYHRDETKEPDNDIYLNLVMEFIPETVYRITRNHTKAKKLIPLEYIRVYMWQLCRALNYIHTVGVAHRDIKPQNLLLDSSTHVVKLCDFGSAKRLIKGQPNVAYICSRFYRAPELIFGAQDYTTDIDIWSLGCVFAEMLLGYPLFAGESGVDQLVEIIKILGTPSKSEILAMNPNYNEFKFPQVKPLAWAKVFRKRTSPEVVDLISKFLIYRPELRIRPLEALAHEFFDVLRDPTSCLPDGKQMPPLFNFTDAEISQLKELGLFEKICAKMPLTSPNAPVSEKSVSARASIRTEDASEVKSSSDQEMTSENPVRDSDASLDTQISTQNQSDPVQDSEMTVLEPVAEVAQEPATEALNQEEASTTQVPQEEATNSSEEVKQDEALPISEAIVKETASEEEQQQQTEQMQNQEDNAE